ncbi:lytic transglycosylase domain-containing protein [Stakelama flava]|nr:lytic transglycosylase domain-containing protein [Stakelama flava]
MATPVDAQPVTRWEPFVAEAATRFAIPEDWIWRVMRAESGGRTHLHGRPIRSASGAMGLMQLMPGTWAEMRSTQRLGADPDDPRDNILAGTAYLRAMYGRFGYPGLFAAYHAGPARYIAWIEGRRALPEATLAYVAAVSGAELAPPAVLPLDALRYRREGRTGAPPPWRQLFVPFGCDPAIRQTQ